MSANKTALATATAGVVAGVAGLVVLASPAGANEPPPALPPVSPEALVTSVLNATPPAAGGTVEVDNNLGLPIPGLPGGNGGTKARVYSDGTGKFRLQLPTGSSERTIVSDGTTVWLWNSADRTVTKTSHPEQREAPGKDKLTDPAQFATKLVAAMREDSTITVDGTARVAGRPAYELVLTPKPTERTLLREVKIAVDSEKRIPLRVDVLANGQAKPALHIGFAELNVGPQDPALFTFTPPPGAKVTEEKPGDKAKVNPKDISDLLSQANAQVIGQGWDTTVAGRIPAQALSQLAPQAGKAAGRPGGKDVDPMALLKQFAKPVSGPYGQGWLISTNVGGALITADGKFAIGAVPEQVLSEAIGQVK